MIYLLLSIIFSSMISIVMRVGETRAKNKTSMLAVNYLTCMITGVLSIGPGNIFTGAEGTGYALGLGAINGFFFMSALMASQYCIARTGIVLPSVFSRMGALLVPLGFSILLFGELPSAIQIIGSVLAIAGILLMNLKGGSSGRLNHAPALFMLLFVEGMASAMTKIYQETGNTALSDNFLLYTFSSAFLICLIVLIAKKERPGLNELFFGAMIGIPNFLGTRFMLRALERMPAIIAYPCRSVTSIALIAIVGVLVFKEKLSKRQIAAMAVIVVALALLNI